MKNYISIIALFWCISLCPLSVSSQVNCADGSVTTGETYSGQVFFNYGAVNNAFSTKNRTTLTVGEPLTGVFAGQQYNGLMGFYGRFLLPPLPPTVVASQGELLDRIQVTWTVDPLSPDASEGFNIYRDNIFLSSVGKNVRSYNDFNVIAGRPYVYKITGINEFGEGTGGEAIGFQTPNGVVTGKVETKNHQAVADALVTLTPLQGFSAAFGYSDGAFFRLDPSVTSILPDAGNSWTIAFWVQTDSAAGNGSVIRIGADSLYFRAKNSSSGTDGIEVSYTATGSSFLSASFPDSTRHGWHHVALTYNAEGSQGRLYLDGALVNISTMTEPGIENTIDMGASTGHGNWAGRADELRIYHKLLEEVDLDEVMMGTASSLTPGLAYYWKFDEEQGAASFDIMTRQKMHFCGASFSSNRPNVKTSGKTNEDGYYRIEGVSYGTGTTFLATPSKDFYTYRALRFNRSQSDYAGLPDFSLTPKATVELWVNSSGPDGTQTVMSKKWGSNEFRLNLVENGNSNDIVCQINGSSHNFGTLGVGYQLLSLVIDSSGTNRTVTLYKNGVLAGNHTFTGVTGNWSDTTQTWILGGYFSGSTLQDSYGGFIDEVAVYDTTLSQTAIQSHYDDVRISPEAGLVVYFPMNEGNGNRVNSNGSLLLPHGTTYGTEWSSFASRQETTPHDFSPDTRQVTLNPSVTSVDLVDFVDLSTIPVSGYVRYKNTDCFAKNVEILVNGASFSPKIFTDSTGRFVVELNPGDNAVLSPSFEDHQFTPAQWQVTNVNNPVAGILFNDITVRSVHGQVAGGNCKKSIIKAPPGMGQGTVCTVKVRSSDGCLERQQTIDNQEGDFEFLNLPPLEGMIVSVIEHSDPDIKNAFQTAGGSTVDLRKKDTIINFIYYGVPEIEITGFDPEPGCSPEIIVLDKGQPVTIDIKLKEVYESTPSDDGVCYLDTANTKIINYLSEIVLDTVMGDGVLTYSFVVGNPNPSPPYLKNFQVVATALPSGREVSTNKQIVVTGIRNKESTFTSLMPTMPSVILRDPPGDGSYAYLEKGTSLCHAYYATLDIETGFGGALDLSLGGDVTLVTGIGVATVLETSTTYTIGTDFTLTWQKTSDSTFQTCTTLNERLSTNAGDLIVGGEQGGDIYMGEAFNLIFGFADVVSFNNTTCSPEIESILNVEPDEFPTVFIYSEYQIKNYINRYIDSLLNNPDLTQDEINRYQESKERWEAILESNQALKDSSAFVRNLSFDALVEYEYSETSDTTYSPEQDITRTFNNDEGFYIAIGGDINGLGVEGQVNFIRSRSVSEKNEELEQKGITTGYVFADDDPGDAFSVDVYMDSVYKTPVFKTKSGQSMCPWEPGTAHREGNTLEFRDGSVALLTDVPPDEPAVYKFYFGNNSQTNETRSYAFTAGPESNPHGGVIKLNGAPLDHPVMYAIPYGESIPVTVTLERGPEEYNYDSLEVVLYSDCEDTRANILGILPDDDRVCYSAHYISAHFTRPCSEVDINVPQQNWVVFPDPNTTGSDDVLRVNVSGYDTSATDFQLVRLQYRPSDGDGSWINVTPLSDIYNPNWSGYDALPDPKPSTLQPGFTQYYWQTAGLADGPYEMRAVSVCSGNASDKPGYSQIIKGRIDREPPSLLGTPEPADGVFSNGDEISCSFNKLINCNLIQADQMNPNNVGLYDAETDALIDATISCYENKLIIVPNVDNRFIENKTLRVELHDIEDKTGNKRDYLAWDFKVDRNELAWLTDSVGMTKDVHETKTMTASIYNRSGSTVPFKIVNSLPWVRVVPDTGVLVANEIKPIQFIVDSTLAIGSWSGVDTLKTIHVGGYIKGGSEPLKIGARVLCDRPAFSTISNFASTYENTMNLVLKVNIQGQFSVDPEDMVAAYIGDQLRGRCNVQFVPQLNAYLAFLTVYGNPGDLQAPVQLLVWDAQSCLVYASVQESFHFVPDQVIGTPLSPQVIHTAGYILRRIPLGIGWNWVSFNLHFPNNSINSALAFLKHPQDGLVKSQSSFASYVTGTGWAGSLTSVNNVSMYNYNSHVNDTLKMIGGLISPDTLPITVVQGWNWIGYVPNYSLPVNDALGSLPAAVGDIIKSQEAFAQYIGAPHGWIGNLKFMEAPKGYQIKVANPGTLTYPENTQFRGGEPADRGENPEQASFWTVNPSQYEYGSTFIGMLSVDGANATTASLELGAFHGDEVRGSAQAVFIPSMNMYLFFMTMYSNVSGQPIHFKLYNAGTGEIIALSETMTFTPDQHQGTVASPVPFTLTSTGTSEGSLSVTSFSAVPNPFHSETYLQFVTGKRESAEILITDVCGNLVTRIEVNTVSGLNTVQWNAAGGNPAGVYLAQLKTESGVLSCKLILQ